MKIIINGKNLHGHAKFSSQIEKTPENYNEEDLRTVRDYEEKVQFLQSERERYVNLLYAEYAKLANLTREGMRKFNARLADLLTKKLEIDTGILHQNLQVNRQRYINYKRILLSEQENDIM